MRHKQPAVSPTVSPETRAKGRKGGRMARIDFDARRIGPTVAEAAATFNAQHPILDVFAGHDLKRIGKEHHGPCPLCAGHDRFCVWPARGRAWCRQCKAAGDALGWSMRLAGHNPDEKGETARYLEARGYLGRAETPHNRAERPTPTRNTPPINLGAINPIRGYYADFLRERRAVLVIDGGLTPRQANAEARRLLKLIRERESHAHRP